MLRRSRLRTRATMLVVPMRGLIRGLRAYRGLSPDFQHTPGGLRPELIKKSREVVDTLDGLANGRVEKQQHPLKHRTCHAKSFGGNQDGLAGIIAGDPLGERVADTKGPLKR